MKLKSYLKMTVYFLLVSGMALFWSCKKDEDLIEPSPVEAVSEETTEELDISVDVNVDIIDIEKSDEDEDSEKSSEDEREGSVNISEDSVLILNINQNNLDDYELWECEKTDVIISYFLNKNPSVIDDEGTPKQRKRICELFRIRTIEDNKPEVNLIYWAHNQKDWCEKKMNEALALNESEDEKRGGFRCYKIEDLSFIFDEE